MSESAPKMRRLKIDTGSGRVRVLVPAEGTVADACAAAEASGRVGKRRISTFALPDGCELVAGDRIADAVEDGEELRPVFEETCAEGGPDEGAGRGGAGLGEAKRRRVEHGQGSAAVSGSPEGGARDEGKEGSSVENDGESADAGGERGDADGGQQRVSEDDGAVGGEDDMGLQAVYRGFSAQQTYQQARAAARAGGGAGDGTPRDDAARQEGGDMGATEEGQGEGKAEVELRLRMWGGSEEIVRVRPDSVDLTAHTGLVALPAELRACAGRVRSLAVRSKWLEALPAWLGELTGLTELRVDGMGINLSLKELPDAVSQLTTLRALELRGCQRVKALPQGLSSLTGLQDLLLMDCWGLKEVPAWVTALTGLRVPFEEWRVRVRSKEGKEEEVLVRVRPDMVDLTAHTGLVALPAELRTCAGRVRALAVKSERLEALPAWLGELTGLTELQVGGGWDAAERKMQYCPLRELPKEVGQLTRLQTLDLSDCSGLTALPADLLTLTGLRELDLRGCSGLTALPAELGTLTGLQKLVLRVCSGLTALPAELGALTDLQELDLLRCSGLTALPAELEALTGLRKLSLSQCSGLTALPAELGALTDLQKLDLSVCKGLTALPAELGTLTGLRELNLSYCSGLTALPAELGALTDLQTLDLYRCSGLTALPAELGTLTGLRELNLRSCSGLTALPAELGALTRLRELKLTSCSGLTALPAELGTLTGLQELDLSDCSGLTALPAELGTLTGLQELDLSGCSGLTALPAELGALTGLRELNLLGSGLTALPAELGALTDLRKLGLFSCSGLTALPAELGALTGLRDLDLHYCSGLTALPAELGTLTDLQELDLYYCTALHTPPPRVVAAGTDAVLAFLRDLGGGSAPCHLVKLVLLGEQRAGKSSLADSLVNGRPATRPANDRTVGIDVVRWWLGAGQGKDPEELVAYIYDAAGHHVYHATHGAFMSDNALFLHVVRSNTSEEEAAAAVLEWVEAVQQEAPGAVMGVVWTHVDLQVEAKDDEEVTVTYSSSESSMSSMDMEDSDEEKDEKDDAEEDDEKEEGEEEDDEEVTTAAEFDARQRRVLAHVQAEIERQVRAVDKAMRQAEGEFEADAAWREKQAQRDAELESLDKGFVSWQETGGQSAGSESIGKAMDALTRLATLHHEMHEIEERMVPHGSEQHDRDEAKQRLQRLREQRVKRPRILFSYGVSSKTGYGLKELREALAALMKDQRLFPHVGMNVPLSYAMLERLAQEGRVQANPGPDATEAPQRAAWEQGVTVHVDATATAELRALCAQPYVSLRDLERAAAKVGIDKEQLHRALQFLHATGSVLYYGSGTRQHSQKLQEVVFMQPQFIIDLIKYVIRESRGEDVNDELRAMDNRIRGTPLKDDLDLLLDRGELTQSLLAELWAQFKFKAQDQRLMLELMKCFKLLRELGKPGNDERYVVPAMLPTGNLPPEFLEPRWWRPSRANAAARIEEDDAHRPAAVRVMCEVVGGQLPFGFMGELQVSLAQSEEAGDADLQEHFAPERSVEEERVGGSVLCERRGNAKEWVVLSHHHGCRPAHVSGAGAAGGGGEARAPALRVMAWVEMIDAQQPAVTEWRLFRHVRKQIRDAAQKVPGLNLREMACYVEDGATLAKPFDLSRLRGRDQEYIGFEFDGAERKHVKRRHVLPSADSEAELRLVPRIRCRGSARVFLGYRVASDLDLVKRLYHRLSDEGVDVWWDKLCLEDGRRWEEGFADGLCSADMFVPVLSRAALAPCADLTAGSDTCDNVVLEHQLAIELEKRGQIRAIFPVFVGERQSQHSDVYGNFFDDGGFPKCRDEVVGRIEEKLTAHLSRLGKGAPRLPASERAVAATLKRIADFQGACFQGSSADAMDEVVVRVRKLVMKLETETLAGAGESTVSSAAVAVRPSAEKQDDGTQPSASQGRLPVIEGFFCKKIADKKQLQREIEALRSTDAMDRDEQLKTLESMVEESVETIDVHQEAQELKNLFTHVRPSFHPSINAQPCFKDFTDSMQSARGRNVRLLHVAGHGNRKCGFFWLKSSAVSTEYEEVPIAKLSSILKTEAAANGGTIECVVLNACETEEMGKKLRSAGVPHVVCWRSEVQDTTAKKFAVDFYSCLNQQEQGQDYRRAFEQAVARMDSGGGAARAPQKHLARGAVDYVCLLSKDGDEFPDTGHICVR